jgi:hypothetical protein
MNYRFSVGNAISATLATMSALAWALLHFDVAHIAGWWPYVLLPAIFLLAAAWGVVDIRSQGEHRRAMARFAENVEGWDFSPMTLAYRGRLAAFPFGVGRELRDIDAVHGPFDGYPCGSFTHQYEQGKEDEVNAPSSWQIDIVDLPYPLAKVDIVPEDFLAHFAKFLGGRDIDFESAEFNAAWRIKAGDAKYAHDIIHPRMMERLLRADAQGMAIRIEGMAVYAWAANRRGPDELARRLGVLTAVARLIPEFVYREFKEVYDRLADAERQREENAPAWATTPFALSSGHYTDLGRNGYRTSEVAEIEGAGEGAVDRRGAQSETGAAGWDAPPEDPHRVDRG